MQYDELVNIIMNIKEDIDDYSLLLATRTVDDVLLEKGRAQVRNISHIKLRSDTKQLYFFPANPSYSERQASRFSIKEFKEFNSNNLDQIGSYEAWYVGQLYEKKNGQMLTLSGEIVGSYVHHKDRMIWVLEAPIEQWQDE